MGRCKDHRKLQLKHVYLYVRFLKKILASLFAVMGECSVPHCFPIVKYQTFLFKKETRKAHQHDFCTIKQVTIVHGCRDIEGMSSSNASKHIIGIKPLSSLV